MIKSILIIITSTLIFSQSFERTQLPVEVYVPWEITVGPNDYLWLTEWGGSVTRIDPVTYERKLVYRADDYTVSAFSETNFNCAEPRRPIHGTLGLALHPDFANPDSSFIYYYYSYNAGTEQDTITKMQLRRIKWDPVNEVAEYSDILRDGFPTSLDHVGGRLMAIEQNGENYLILAVGDTGLQDGHDIDCFQPQSLNPNKQSQNINTLNGKIHRFNMDGTIPDDNPIPGNSLITRGHRNPQGLAYNPNLELIYDIEHGDGTDDEINLLEIGKNYGWPNVHGFHDGNVEGEDEFVANYEPMEEIENDGLVEPLFSWCPELEPEGPGNGTCTIAPSDAIYYNYDAIPEWKNSILIVTLKDAQLVDKTVVQCKMTEDGFKFVEGTEEDPNPKYWFAEDQESNGRLRDIAISNDGLSIYLVHNGGADHNNITKYTYKTNSIKPKSNDYFYPNPVEDNIKILKNNINEVKVYDVNGKIVLTEFRPTESLNLTSLISGYYIIEFEMASEKVHFPMIKR